MHGGIAARCSLHAIIAHETTALASSASAPGAWSHHLEDGDQRPQKAVEVLALADASVVARRVGYFVTELAAEQIHSENTARHKQQYSTYHHLCLYVCAHGVL